MRKFRTFTTTIALLIALQGFSQTKGFKISGKAVASSKYNIESATASLLKVNDSLLLKTSLTDAGGVFIFENLAPGDYLISVSASGHKTVVSNPITVNESQKEVTLPPFELDVISKDLQGVVVQGKKPFIEQKMDKMVVNVDALLTNAGSTALEVLEKSPGITIDKDGAISLKGKQQVLVMMDGRPTYLGPNELANLLRSMPASSIDQIEIMTNPSAKYDAAGNSGVINIRTKKNKQKGFNGSLTLNYGQGVYWRTNDNFNLNYRTGKVNIFANGGYSKWNGFQDLEIERKFKDQSTGDLTAILDSKSRMRNKSDNYTLKLGADYYLNNKTTIGFVSSGFINPEEMNSQNTSYLKNALAVTDSIVTAASYNSNKWKNGSLNLNLRHQFDSTGRELTVDLDYVTYKATSEQQFINTTFSNKWVPQNIEELRGDLPVNIDIYSAKADYTQNIGKIKMETGVKTSYVETDNSAFYYNQSSNGEVPDYSKTNSFLYKENINAVYVSFNKQIRKFGIQAGLRYEHTYIRGLQYGNPVNNDSSFTRSYGNLFPTVYVTYEAGKNHQWGLNYGRRIDRPAYQDLNPFLFFLDKYTYQSGNPFIRPQFSDNIELSHTYKGFLTTTLNYSYTTDFQTETFEQEKLSNGEESYATIVRQGNIGQRHSGGVAVSAQVPVKKWWTAILYTNLNYSKFTGELNDERINVEATNLMVNVNNQFKFKKGWSAEISGWYRTKGVEGQIMINPMGQLSAAVSKNILKDKGTLKLNVRDILYTQQVSGNINFQSTEAYFYNARDSRVATFTFVYRFGKPIKGTKARKSGGAGDEQSRVKLGNNN
jgi:outer membrane receptor protein involved in Fe transport